MSKSESEKTQLQGQISQLNAAIVALKGEQNQQSDAVLVIERQVKEKEQVISELGTVINAQKNSIVMPPIHGLFIYRVNSKRR